MIVVMGRKRQFTQDEEQAIRDLARAIGIRPAARRFGLSPSTVHEIVNREAPADEGAGPGDQPPTGR